MKIIISPDSFKGTLSAPEAAQAIQSGLKNVWPHADYVTLPIADGGEGTLDVLVELTKGAFHFVTAQDPLGRAIEARYGILGDEETAVIEMAEASGIMRVDVNERDPFRATTFGTGELIRHALDQGCRHFIIAIGGSATNDGGIGVLRALGLRFYDEKGVELKDSLPDYQRLHRIDVSEFDPRILGSKFTIACDVDNPLLGERGATAVFGPQKGVQAHHAEVLEKSLTRYAEVVEQLTGKSVHLQAGAGAAGGLGAALLAFFPAELKRGIDTVLEAIAFDRWLKGADLVITGEGRSDKQTLSGKAPLGVAQWAKEAGVKTVLLSGRILPEDRALFEKYFDHVYSVVSDGCTVEQALTEPAVCVAQAAERVAKVMGEVV